MRQLVAAGLVLCGTIVVTVMLFEESLIFFPSPWPAGVEDAGGLAVGSGRELEDCWFETEDGLRLHGLWSRGPGEPTPRAAGDGAVVLWFHGNAGNIADRAPLQLELTGPGRQVLAVDYRGYGRSRGHPTGQGVGRDATAAWRFLTVERGVPAGAIVLLGESLGGAVAVELAARVAPAGLIVESSFTSIRAMARHHYPFLPSGLLRTRLDPLSRIGEVLCPILFIHSTDDEIVPFSMGWRLYEAAPASKQFFRIEGAGHNDTWAAGGVERLTRIADFVAACTASGRSLP